MSWKLDVVSGRGVTVRTYSGTTEDRIDTSWDLRDASGLPVLPGTYTMRLTGASGGDTALPFTTVVEVIKPRVPKGSWRKPGDYATGREPRPIATPTPSATTG